MFKRLGASVLVLWFPPGVLSGGSSESREIFGPSGLSVAFMVCSALHVALLVLVRMRGPAPAPDGGGRPGPESERPSPPTQDD